MINEFKIKIESLIGKPTNQKLLVAVSGGVDSIVLAHFLFKLKYNISIAHVNYELRGISSEYDEEIVRKFSKNFNLKIFVKRNSLLNEDTGIQEKARKVRYSWFNNLRLKYNFDFIITAHHANDQIETFF
jgi:tRNA(Ile)-lysidine synthase